MLCYSWDVHVVSVFSPGASVPAPGSVPARLRPHRRPSVRPSVRPGGGQRPAAALPGGAQQATRKVGRSVSLERLSRPYYTVESFETAIVMSQQQRKSHDRFDAVIFFVELYIDTSRSRRLEAIHHSNTRGRVSSFGNVMTRVCLPSGLSHKTW